MKTLNPTLSPPALEQWEILLNDHLEESLKHFEEDIKLMQAMRYAVLSGGKRFRGQLVFATGLDLGGEYFNLVNPAASVELMHAYSLIHDDLPAMDDDDLRRGKPSCHIAFDEATAILAGDALQSFAFEILATPNYLGLDARHQLEMCRVLAVDIGAYGMAGGQSLDLISTDKKIDLKTLETIHTKKTAQLLTACVRMGALCANVTDPEILRTLDDYALKLGLAYQVQDDILDIEATTEQLGKTQGADIWKNKATYPRILGMQKAKALRDQYYAEALSILDSLDADTTRLKKLTQIILSRNN